MSNDIFKQMRDEKQMLGIILSQKEDDKPMRFYEEEELYGLHTLSGVDIIEDTGDGRKCRFILDGESIEGSENPDDGYRSYMGCIYDCDEQVKNTFDDELVVICGFESFDKGHRCSSGIQFLDAHTGDVVLILGTVALDDYYPCCRMEWNPENLYENVTKG